MKHILFSNYFWENDEYGKDQYDYARDYLFSEYSEDEDWETQDDVPDERVVNEVYAQSEWYWEDFKTEFGKFIKDSDYGFLLCGDIGTWRGSVAGGCYVNEFDDLYKFWEDCRDVKVYDEGGHLYIQATHHDGTNYYEYRVIREDRNIENLLDAIYNGEEISRARLNYYTKSLYPYVAKIYGW